MQHRLNDTRKRVASDLDEMPAVPRPGRYYCTLVDHELVIEESVDGAVADA